jgi:hypothetical protein
MSRRRVAIVHLGRAGSLGATGRVASLRSIFAGAGADVTEVPLLADHRSSLADVVTVPARALARGDLVPEALAWSPRGVRARLNALHPRVVVAVTSRAFHPTLVDGPWTVVLDLVDELSASYRDRARVVAEPHMRALFTVLSLTSARFERRAPRQPVAVISAGWGEARRLGVTWVPLVVNVPPPPAGDPAPKHDLVFFGNLAYPPNTDAVNRLGELWPEIVSRRPGTTLLVAGANPSSPQQALAAELGWTLVGNFERLSEVLGDARAAIVPLRYASGIQAKVLEAAAHGLAQVADTVALAGLAPGFPAVVAQNDDDLVAGACSLLDHTEPREQLATAARRHVQDRYAAGAWTPWAREILDAGSP